MPRILGRALGCLAVGGIAWTLAQPAWCYAQSSAPSEAELDTQQRTNQRILELSRSTRTPPHDYIVGRGDVVSVEVFDVPELTREVRVSQTGTIGIPLVPVRLYVVGLTELQVQQKIAEVLEANGLVSHPQVMVSVKERRSKPIAVVGAVAHPMVYQADHPVTLIEVLAEAGGIGNDAGDTVIITRPESVDSTASEPPEIAAEDAVPATNPSAASTTTPPSATANGSAEQTQKAGATSDSAKVEGGSAGMSQAMTAGQADAAARAVNDTGPAPLPNTITVNLSELLERGDTQNNVPLQAGDIVTVPHAGIVYALGAVARPGGFVATNDRSQLSTLKVLALAGGMTSVAKKDRAVIIRRDSTGKQQEIPVDLARIVKRESEDVRLMPSDILYIPPSTGKAAFIKAAEITAAVGMAVAIYRIGTRN